MSNTPRQFKRPSRSQTFKVVFDPNDAAELVTQRNALTEAQEALTEATDAGRETKRLQKAVDDAQAAYDAEVAKYETITFTIQAMSTARLQIIQTEHPATKAQIEAQRKSDPDADPPEFDVDKYPPALLAAACTKVEWSDGETADGISEADATDFWESSSAGDQRMFLALIGLLNQAPSLVGELGKGSAGTPASAASPTTS